MSASAILDIYGKNSVLYEAERQARRKAYTRGHYRIKKARAVVLQSDPTANLFGDKGLLFVAYALLWGMDTLSDIPETLLDPDFIAQATKRMHDAGLWTDGCWKLDCIDPDTLEVDQYADTELILHALVAEGRVDHVPGKGYRLAARGF